MNWYYIGLGIFTLIVAFLVWRRSDKIARNNNEVSRSLFRGLAPDMDPDAPKFSAVIIGLLGIALVVLGAFGIWL